MVHETLGDQFRRIGTLPALIIVIAAALASFALLDRVVPVAPLSAVPQTIKPAGRILAPPTSAAVSAGGGQSDPVVAAQRRFERTLPLEQRRQVQLARKQAAAIRRGLKPLSVDEYGVAPVGRPAVGSTQQQQLATGRPTGGVPASGRSTHKRQ